MGFPGNLTLTAWIIIVALLLAILVSIFASRALRFRIMHMWMNFPLIGYIARSAHLKNASVAEANKELDNVFRRYRSHIGSPLSEDYTKRAFIYLHLAGDSDTKRTSIWLWVFLAILLVVESLAFSLLLALRIAPYVSEDNGFRVALGLASVLAVVLAYFGHSAGKSLHRASALARALPEKIDEESALPDAEEKSMADLTGRISLEEDQNRDRGTSRAFDSQRFLNRVQKQDNEQPSFVVGYGYWILMALLALFIFFLRDTEAVVTNANRIFFDQAGAFDQIGAAANAALPAGGEAVNRAEASASWWANLMLSLIFLLAQGVVFWIGHRGTLLGQESERAVARTAGFHSFEDYARDFESKVLKADESLVNLANRIKRNHPQLKPEGALYKTRLRRANDEDSESRDDSGGSPAAPPAAVGDSERDVIRPEFGGNPK